MINSAVQIPSKFTASLFTLCILLVWGCGGSVQKVEQRGFRSLTSADGMKNGKPSNTDVKDKAGFDESGQTIWKLAFEMGQLLAPNKSAFDCPTCLIVAKIYSATGAFLSRTKTGTPYKMGETIEMAIPNSAVLAGSEGQRFYFKALVGRPGCNTALFIALRLFNIGPTQSATLPDKTIRFVLVPAPTWQGILGATDCPVGGSDLNFPDFDGRDDDLPVGDGSGSTAGGSTSGSTAGATDGSTAGSTGSSTGGSTSSNTAISRAMKDFGDLCIIGPVTVGPALSPSAEDSLLIDPATYHWSSSPAGVVSISDGVAPLDRGSGTTTLTAIGSGTTTVSVEVQDVEGTFGIRSFKVTVADFAQPPEVSMYNVLTNSPFELIPTIKAQVGCDKMRSITWRSVKHANGTAVIRLPDIAESTPTFGFSNVRTGTQFTYSNPLTIDLGAAPSNEPLSKAAMAMAWSNDALPPNGIFDCEVEVVDGAGRVAKSPFSVRIDTENRSYGLSVSGGSYGVGSESRAKIETQGPSHFFNLMDFIDSVSTPKSTYPVYLSEYADEGAASMIEPFNVASALQTSCRKCTLISNADWRSEVYPLNATCETCPASPSGIYIAAVHSWSFVGSSGATASCAATTAIQGDSLSPSRWLPMPIFGRAHEIPLDMLHQPALTPDFTVIEWITADLAGNKILTGGQKSTNFNVDASGGNLNAAYGCQEPHVVQFELGEEL